MNIKSANCDHLHMYARTHQQEAKHTKAKLILYKVMLVYPGDPSIKQGQSLIKQKGCN